MFTGIAEGKGIIASLERDDDIVRITVNHSLDNNDISINDSICCSGICLTVVKQNRAHFRLKWFLKPLKDLPQNIGMKAQ